MSMDIATHCELVALMIRYVRTKSGKERKRERERKKQNPQTKSGKERKRERERKKQKRSRVKKKDMANYYKCLHRQENLHLVWRHPQEREVG